MRDVEPANDIRHNFRIKIKEVMGTIWYKKTSPFSCFNESMKSMLSIKVN